MRSKWMFTAVDSHTEGMPTRVIRGGVGVIPGATMNDKRLYFIENLDAIRLVLMNEPRGHAAMSGAILQPSTQPGADWARLHRGLRMPAHWWPRNYRCIDDADRTRECRDCRTGDNYLAENPDRTRHRPHCSQRRALLFGNDRKATVIKCAPPRRLRGALLWHQQVRPGPR